MTKKILLVAIALILVLAFAGCSIVNVNAERDGKRVVAMVNGEKVLKSDVVDQLKLYLNMMGIKRDSANYNDYVESMKDDYLTSAVITELCRQKLKENGLPEVTEEQLKKMEDTLASGNEWAGTLADMQIKREDYESDAQYEKAVEVFKAQYLEDNGYNDGRYRKYLTNGYITENVIDLLMKDYNPTDEDIRAYYEKEMKDQKQVIDEQLSSFMNFENDGILMYVPEGIKYIKYVYIELDADAKQEISEADSDKKDALRDEKLKSIQATADEALEAAKQDFDAAIEKYCPENDKMLGENAMKEGFRVYKGSMFDGEIADAAGKLTKAGDISGLIPTYSGYYIIQMIGEMEAGEKSFEEMKDDLLEYMTKEKKESVFTTSTGEWLDEADIKYYRDRL